MNIVKFDSDKEFVKASADFLYNEVKNCDELCKIALCGGSTPYDTYVAFAEAVSFEGMDGRLSLYELDERYTDPGSDDRNSKMIHKAFSFSEEGIDFNFFGSSANGSVEEVVEEYRPLIDEVDSFDVSVIGVGPDGHIASLFPGFEDLNIEGSVAHTTTEDFAVFDRMTISMEKILESKKIIVLMKGESKQVVLDNLDKGELSVNEFPVMALLNHNDVTIHYLP